MPSFNTIGKHALVTIGVMFGLNALASAIGGQTASVIKGDYGFFSRLFGG